MTPLWEKIGDVYHSRFKVRSTFVYATVTDFNIVRNNMYLIVGVHGKDVEIINELGQKEIYSDEWFSMTKL